MEFLYICKSSVSAHANSRVLCILCLLGVKAENKMRRDRHAFSPSDAYEHQSVAVRPGVMTPIHSIDCAEHALLLIVVSALCTLRFFLPSSVASWYLVRTISAINRRVGQPSAFHYRNFSFLVLGMIRTITINIKGWYPERLYVHVFFVCPSSVLQQCR